MKPKIKIQILKHRYSQIKTRINKFNKTSKKKGKNKKLVRRKGRIRRNLLQINIKKKNRKANRRGNKNKTN